MRDTEVATKTSAESSVRQRLEALNREVERLNRLPDRWLAEALLRLAREFRRQTPGFGDPTRMVYENAYVWHIVPEVAKRLGATRLEPNEARRYSGLTDAELRFTVQVYLTHMDLSVFRKGVRSFSSPDAGELIASRSYQINPVQCGVDRLDGMDDALEDDQMPRMADMTERKRDPAGADPCTEVPTSLEPDWSA